MKTLIITFFIFLSVFSCKYGVIMNINNETDEFVTNIKITNGFNDVKLDTLKRKSKENLFLDFKSNNPKTDGGFEISFEKKNEKKSQKFDYYSNGIPLVSSYEIIIKNDTIIVK